ncbi:MAG: GNAT family N-acetyltransferase [Acidobacteria bacterium]|nr:GNAT family N-acetyltransferase [Acidobacteriota bacterium]
MPEIDIREESITSPGALSVVLAATDELNRRYGSVDDDMATHLDELGPPLGCYLVARENGHLAGGVGLRAIGQRELAAGEVKRLWVRPDLRRSGFAKLLMDALETKARELGYRVLFLETGDGQPEALRFYPKHGWQRVENFPAGAFTHHLATRFNKQL